MLQSKKLHLCCLLLAILMLLPLSLTACGDPTGDGASGGSSAETTAGDQGTQATTGSGSGGTQGTQEILEIIDPEVEDWVEIYDMGVDGGARQINFVTVTGYNTGNYFFRHEEDGDVLAGDALAVSASTRTLYLEELFNVAFNVIEFDAAALYTQVQGSIMGNGGQYDIIYPHPTHNMLNFLSEGLFHNLYNFDAIDLSKPWWNQSEVREFSIEERLYIAVNDLPIAGMGFHGVVYNRTLYNEQRFAEDPYSLVYDGEWTMAKIGELAMQFGEGAGADGVLGFDDKIGYVLQQYNPYWGAGGRVISKDDSGEFYIAIDPTHSDLMASEYYTLIWETENHVWYSDESYYNATFANTKTLAAFKSGNILFYTYELGGLYKHLWDATFDIGYLPQPMVNTEQEDYYAAISSGFLAIPQKCKDPNANAVLLEALAVHCYTYHRKNFFENILLSRMSEKPEDYKMLTLIHETKIYDWGSHLFVGDESNSFLNTMVVDQKSKTVSSFIRGRKKAWEKLLLNIDQIRNGEFAG